MFDGSVFCCLPSTICHSCTMTLQVFEAEQQKLDKNKRDALAKV